MLNYLLKDLSYETATYHVIERFLITLSMVTGQGYWVSAMAARPSCPSGDTCWVALSGLQYHSHQQHHWVLLHFALDLPTTASEASKVGSSSHHAFHASRYVLFFDALFNSLTVCHHGDAFAFDIESYLCLGSPFHIHYIT